MKFIQRAFLSLFLSMGAVCAPAMAADAAPLFINLSTDDPQRAGAAINFGQHQHESGHPLTIFLSDRGVLLASRTQIEKGAAQQQMLDELIKKGATVLVVPMSMKHYGIKETDLLPGVKISNRKLSGEALFRDNTRTLSW